MDYVCNANGSRNNWKRIRCTDRTGSSRSMDLPETAVVSDRCGIFTSFGAILGIILIEPVYAGEKAEKEKKEREKKPVFLKGLSASFAVNTVLMGPVLWFYYEIPVYSVILNLVVIPLLPVAWEQAFGVGNPPVFRTGRWWMSESLQSNSVDL